MRLLLLSNSTMPGEPYLDWPRAHLADFLGSPRRIAFVPYAGVRMDWAIYARRVSQALAHVGGFAHCELESLHAAEDPVAALDGADAVAVGGGNTFHLLHHLRATGLLDAIRARVREGLPYVGWSAGSNVACPTIRTTNDMPIVDPFGFDALGLVPFQINAHYTDAVIPNHGGETRAERLLEFAAANPGMPVVALPEGCGLRVEDGRVALLGTGPALLFGGDSGPAAVGDAGLTGLLSGGG